MKKLMKKVLLSKDTVEAFVSSCRCHANCSCDVRDRSDDKKHLNFEDQIDSSY